MVQVRVGEKDMLDTRHLLQGQIAHTGTRVDQNILIDHQGGSAQAIAYTTAAT